MEAMTELCDLVAQNPDLFADKLAWICSRCPPAASLLPPQTGIGSARVTRSHLNALIALARFLSKCSDLPADVSNVRSTLLDFLRAIPSVAFRLSFWPQSFSLDTIAVFFSDLLRYISIAADLSLSLGSDLSLFFGKTVVSAVVCTGDDTVIARAFLSAVAQNCPSIPAADAEKLVTCLLENFVPEDEGVSSSGSENSMSWGSSTLSKGKAMEEDVVDDGSSEISSVQNGGSVGGRSSAGSNGGGGGGGSAAFPLESAEGLEKLGIAFRLVRQVLDGGGRIKPEQLELFQKVAAKQLKSLPAFLKIRKRDWKEQGPQLKSRISAKLSCCQAAIEVQTKGILSLDVDGKASKDALRRTLALLLDAAEACIISSWRKLKSCEDLFSTLLYGISQITVFRGGQLLRVLLIPLKPLVLTTCAQADMLGNNPGAMFVAVTKLSCEIVEFGWSKDRALVDTFIMGLAACIRERNDYEEQDGKEKHAVPAIQHNLIRLLADLSVTVNKWEVVDMILPLFIESLEEGDASSPSLLRLRLLDAVSHMACLGFEKSYRETVVLMTRSYLDKIKNVGNAEINSLPSEAATERMEGFFWLLVV